MLFIVNETDFSHTVRSEEFFSPADMNLNAPETGEQTIRRVMASYDLGHKLRQLRLRKKIALVDLGKHTGLSASMLSQLETGKMIPTLPTLARISMVFDVGLDYFFDTKRRRKTFTIVRSSERLQFPDRPDSALPNYFFECLAFSAQEKELQAYLAEFPKRKADECRVHLHEGSEFIFVTKGELIVMCQGEDHSLAKGDSVYFDSSEPHSYRCPVESGAQAVVITTGAHL
jgi:transcriptional regulator with XRE-family HTH domain